MKLIFLHKVDFTPLKVLFAVLAISLVGFLSDVSALTHKPDMFRPDLINLKDELKMCPDPVSPLSFPPISAEALRQHFHPANSGGLRGENGRTRFGNYMNSSGLFAELQKTKIH